MIHRETWSDDTDRIDSGPCLRDLASYTPPTATRGGSELSPAEPHLSA